jgi:hypothetical protein
MLHSHHSLRSRWTNHQVLATSHWVRLCSLTLVPVCGSSLLSSAERPLRSLLHTALRLPSDLAKASLFGNK